MRRRRGCGVAKREPITIDLLWLSFWSSWVEEDGEGSVEFCCVGELGR